jgi:hypothetical protein
MMSSVIRLNFVRGARWPVQLGVSGWEGVTVNRIPRQTQSHALCLLGTLVNKTWPTLPYLLCRLRVVFWTSRLLRIEAPSVCFINLSWLSRFAIASTAPLLDNEELTRCRLHLDTRTLGVRPSFASDQGHR